MSLSNFSLLTSWLSASVASSSGCLVFIGLLCVASLSDTEESLKGQNITTSCSNYIYTHTSYKTFTCGISVLYFCWQSPGFSHNAIYLTTCSSSCSVSGSLSSVLSGRPFVAREVDSDSFGLFSGLGVPGPFTFLP
jgi:hypothetical protein